MSKVWTPRSCFRRSASWSSTIYDTTSLPSCATLTAFNHWVEDDWGYGNDGRIFGVPLLSLTDVDWAVEELDRVTALGAQDRQPQDGFGLGTLSGRPLLRSVLVTGERERRRGVLPHRQLRVHGVLLRRVER